MPRIPTDSTDQSEDTGIEDYISAGNVVPIISHTFSNDLVFGGHDAFIERYTKYIQYPFQRTDDFPRVLQFKSVVDEKGLWDLAYHYVNFAKNHLFEMAERADFPSEYLQELEEEFDQLTFSQFADRLKYPKFDQISEPQLHPLLILANFPLPIYITTSYHGFLEKALEKAKKKPVTEICYWHDGLKNIQSVLDQGFEPSIDEPIVYHLCGYDEYPTSMVLTEDNFLQFLVAISEFRGKDGDRIAGRIREAVSASQILLLGFDLDTWEFRSLFWGLIEGRNPWAPKSVSIQLRPTQEESLFFEKYMAKAKFDVIWSDIDSFLRDLHQKVQS